MGFRILFYILIIWGANLHGQKLQQGNFNVQAGSGIALYDVVSNDSDNETNSPVDAATLVFPFELYYSVSDLFAVGGIFQNERFIVNKDSTNVRGSIFHVGLGGIIRAINKQDCNLNINVCTGYSFLDWQNRINNNGITGKGVFIKGGISYCHFWTNTVGGFLSANFTHINYSEIKNKNSEIITVNYGAEVLELELTGFQLGAGFCFKF